MGFVQCDRGQCTASIVLAGYSKDLHSYHPGIGAEQPTVIAVPVLDSNTMPVSELIIRFQSDTAVYETK